LAKSQKDSNCPESLLNVIGSEIHGDKERKRKSGRRILVVGMLLDEIGTPGIAPILDLAMLRVLGGGSGIWRSTSPVDFCGFSFLQHGAHFDTICPDRGCCSLSKFDRRFRLLP
jgi:hypothetical protein